MTLIELILALIVVLLLGLIILCWVIYRAITVMGFVMRVQNKHIAHNNGLGSGSRRNS